MSAEKQIALTRLVAVLREREFQLRDPAGWAKRELGKCRVLIDTQDREVCEALKPRIDAVRRVGEIKAKTKQAGGVRRLDREANVRENYRRHGSEIGIPPEITVPIAQSIINVSSIYEMHHTGEIAEMEEALTGNAKAAYIRLKAQSEKRIRGIKLRAHENPSVPYENEVFYEKFRLFLALEELYNQHRAAKTQEQREAVAPKSERLGERVLLSILRNKNLRLLSGSDDGERLALTMEMLDSHVCQSLKIRRIVREFIAQKRLPLMLSLGGDDTTLMTRFLASELKECQLSAAIAVPSPDVIAKAQARLAREGLELMVPVLTDEQAFSSGRKVHIVEAFNAFAGCGENGARRIIEKCLRVLQGGGAAIIAGEFGDSGRATTLAEAALIKHPAARSIALETLIDAPQQRNLALEEWLDMLEPFYNAGSIGVPSFYFAKRLAWEFGMEEFEPQILRDVFVLVLRKLSGSRANGLFSDIRMRTIQAYETLRVGKAESPDRDIALAEVA